MNESWRNFSRSRIGFRLEGFRPFLLPLLLCAAWDRGWAEDPVLTAEGPVSGTRGRDPDVRVYRAIPYASPPVGELRWKAPRPVTPWTEVLRADSFGNAPMQPVLVKGSFYQVEVYGERPLPPLSEDCLTLNVWTAARSSAERRPVMVWIYGGGLVSGEASITAFDGENLARKGVVLVSFNYRLGIFGFFAHPELSKESERGVSGNYGLLDQVAALEWVRRNVARFGGDPENVTVFGQSAGGNCINSLLVSPLSRGLFHRVILQSGALRGGGSVSIAEWERKCVDLARSNGLSNLAALRALPAERLASIGGNATFWPNVDGWFFPEPPRRIFEKGGQHPVEMLLGATSSDGGVFRKTSPDVFRNLIEKKYGAKAPDLLRLYPHATEEEASRSRHDEIPDQYLAGARAEARRQAALGVPVWLYRFSRVSPGREPEKNGAFHSAEIRYVFQTLETTDRPWEEVDRRLADRMSSAWVRFAATGNPNGTGLPEWPAYRAETDRFLDWGDEPRSGDVLALKPHLDELETVMGFRLER